MNKKLNKYLNTRAVQGPWQLVGTTRCNFKTIVVIPALDEAETLPHTLASLAHNPESYLQQTLILCVVNNRLKASAVQRENNHRTLDWLRSRPFPPLNIAWIDVCSSGFELPDKEGVGLARKIGFDLALQKLDWAEPPLLVSLDADTLVDSDYLSAIFKHFASSHCGGAVLPFYHQKSENLRQETAIRDYELYLRSYLFGLQQAGSPYAYHTIGCAFACRADVYIAAGGMNRRHAAEDFYFLQQLAKVSGVELLRGTVVQPSPRFSRRVPFGTGQVIRAYIEEGSQRYDFISAGAFQILKDWLSLVSENTSWSTDHFLIAAQRISPVLEVFLEELNFTNAWQRLQHNHVDEAQRLRAFHHWFDALRTRQLLTRLDINARSSAEVVSELLLWGLGKSVDDPFAYLENEQGVNNPKFIERDEEIPVDRNASP